MDYLPQKIGVIKSMRTNTTRLSSVLPTCLAALGLLSISTDTLQAHTAFAPNALGAAIVQSLGGNDLRFASLAEGSRLGKVRFSLLDGGQDTLPSDPNVDDPLSAFGQRDGGES